jgi:hypothetical protein
VNATLLDDRRRLVMPPELPAKSAVTVQQINADTWFEIELFSGPSAEAFSLAVGAWNFPEF